MIGIEEIGVHMPDNSVDNLTKIDAFGLDESFLEEKIGVLRRTQKKKNQKASDLCVEAFKELEQKTTIDKETIECCIVVTQNPDVNIPHTAAIVHGKLSLPKRCACFDISLGCSGYPYGLEAILSFMQHNGLKKGLLFTADPYSEIINPADKNTALLFGDAATVTYITQNPKLTMKGFSFGTDGSAYEELTLKEGSLYMNGRSVFNFAATTVPNDILSLLNSHDLKIEAIDRFILHQGSKFIVETIARRLKLPFDKVPFDIYQYGNTASSSIPIILAKELESPRRRYLISGFGIGLSWASAILEHTQKEIQ